MLPFEKINRTLLVKKKAMSSPKFGSDPNNRAMNDHIEFGIVNIDKPRGPTSHQVSAYVKDILHLDKAGHSGTLDPNVTGVLPIALGKGTRIVQVLLNAGKEYVCIMHLHTEIPEQKIKDTAKKLVGKIKQLPPIKSAVKRDWRYRKIYYLEVIEVDEKDVLFRLGCQAGTYVRKFCHDWGALLGTGAHMAELRRSKAASFSEDTLSTLHDLIDAYWYYKNKRDETKLRKIIRPIEAAVNHLPKVYVMDTTVDTLCHGANLHIPGISAIESEIQVDEDVAIMTLKGELIAIGIAKMISKEIIKATRGIAVITNKVFMQTGTYPKIEKKD